MKASSQNNRILKYLYDIKRGLTRAEINQLTRRASKEIPIQTLCRRLREMQESGRIVSVKARECEVTHRDNAVYQLTGAERSRITNEHKRAS